MENPTIDPMPPLQPDLTWRAITPADLAPLIDLASACQAIDGGLAFLNEPDSLKERYSLNELNASIGAFTIDKQLVACTTLHLIHETSQERIMIVGQVRPDWRNKGLGTYLMRWSQTHARSLFTTGRRLLKIATESLTDSAHQLYLAHGFQSVDESLVMQYDLSLPLPDRPLPPDATIATWQRDLANQFFQAYETAFRKRPGFPGYTAAEWISGILENDNFKSEWSLLARSGSTPIGFLLASAEYPGGYIVQVGVIPSQRRRRLGSILITESMRRMQAAGKTVAQLTVHLNNPGAIQAYRQLGFETVGRRAKYERNAE